MGKGYRVKVLRCVLHSEEGSDEGAAYAILESFSDSIRFPNHLLEEAKLSGNYGRMSLHVFMA